MLWPRAARQQYVLVITLPGFRTRARNPGSQARAGAPGQGSGPGPGARGPRSRLQFASPPPLCFPHPPPSSLGANRFRRDRCLSNNAPIRPASRGGPRLIRSHHRPYVFNLIGDWGANDCWVNSGGMRAGWDFSNWLNHFRSKSWTVGTNSDMPKLVLAIGSISCSIPFSPRNNT